MYRQSPSRNQRSKGIKAKHILQICLLLAVCFWLIYQVKHSHDKKKEFDESDEKSSSVHEHGLIKLGRNDIKDRFVETNKKNEKHDETSEEDEEDVTEEKEEENKIEGVEEDKKIVDMEVGENEIDEHEQENTEEEFVDDEKERDDSDETETEEKDSEDQTEKESPVERSDQDANDRDIHEAREENYKADDASSAVTHDMQTTATENEVSENANDHPEGEKRKDLEVEEGEKAEDENHSNVTTSQNSTSISEISNNSTEFASENHDPSLKKIIIITELQNVTESKSNLETIAQGHADDSTLDMDIKHSDSNSTISTETKDEDSSFEDFSSLSNKTESFASGNSTVEASMDEDNNTRSSVEEDSDSIDSTDEALVSKEPEIPEEVSQDSIDLMDEKDVRISLDTLPEIQTEGTNSEDAAEE